MKDEFENYERPLARRQHIDFLIEKLLELRGKTSPAAGEEAERIKDLNASWAIRLSGELANELAGWAYDHLAGMASEGMSPVPLPPLAMDSNEGYNAARLAAGDHAHEIVGVQLRESPVGMPPTVARKFLQSVMESAPFGREWSRETHSLAEALEALEIGDTKSLLEPASKGRKKSFEEIRWMLHALKQVHFRRARGGQLRAAQEEVAAAYGQDIQTIRTWETRLKAENRLQVDIAIARAERDAERFKSRLKSFYKGEPDEFGTDIFLDEMYGSAALKKAGEAYRQAARDRVMRRTQFANQNSRE